MYNSEQYRKSLSLCAKEKHKIRENQFGVVWCLRCGRLFPNNFAAKPLQPNEVYLISSMDRT